MPHNWWLIIFSLFYRSTAISVADGIFLVLLAIAAIRGAARGFTKETLTAGAVICGLFGAIVFSKLIVSILERYLSPSAWNIVFSFLGIFIVIYLVFKLSEGILLRAIDKVRLVNLDRALGLLFGLIEGVVIIVLFLFIMRIQPFFSSEQLLEESVVIDIISPLLPYTLQLLQERV